MFFLNGVLVFEIAIVNGIFSGWDINLNLTIYVKNKKVCLKSNVFKDFNYPRVFSEIRRDNYQFKVTFTNTMKKFDNLYELPPKQK